MYLLNEKNYERIWMIDLPFKIYPVHFTGDFYEMSMEH